MLKRLLGVVMVVIGLVGIGVGILGARAIGDVIDSIEMGLDTNLTLLSQSLDTVEDTLLLAKAFTSDIQDSLETVEQTADDMELAVRETQPLLDQISTIVSEEVPTSVEAVQTAIPNITQVAGAINDTLVTLNNFRIDEEIFGIEIKYDLGINYEPTVPFDESVSQLGDSIETLPGRLRSLAVYINVSNENLSTISQNIHALSDDITAINERFDEVGPLLDDYIRIVVEINDQSRQIKTGLNDQLESVQQSINIAMIWLVLTQVAPLYLGWELITGRRARALERIDKLEEALAIQQPQNESKD